MDPLSETQIIKMFFDKNRWLILYTYLLVFICFGAKIIFYNYSIDTEDFIVRGSKTGFVAWAQMGRPGLYLLKHFITGYSVNVLLINIATYIWVGMVGVFVSFLVYRLYKNTRGLWIMPTLMVTSAILLEQYNFILQSAEVAFSNLLVLFSVYFTFRFAAKQRKRFVVFGLVCGVVAFSVYPSNYVTFIVVALILMIGRVNKSKTRIGLLRLGQIIQPYLWMFAAIFLLYRLFFWLTLKILGVKEIPYVQKSIAWGRFSAADILSNVQKNLWETYSGSSSQAIFFGWSFTLALFLVILTALMVRRNKGPLLFLVISLILAVNLNFFILSGVGPIRTLVPYFPIAFAFMYFFIFKNLRLSLPKLALIPLILFIGIRQGVITIRFAFQENKVYTEAVDYTEAIVARLKELGIRQQDLSDYKLAVNGRKFFLTEDELVLGDVLGHSWYDWDSRHMSGSTGRITGFFNAQGFPVKEVSDEEYLEIHYLFGEMAPFPAESGLQINDDIILVKTSEPQVK